MARSPRKWEGSGVGRLDSSSVLIGFLVTALSACGGDSQKNLPAGAGAQTMTDAGAGFMGGEAGAEPGEGGAGGNAGAAARGGVGAGGTSAEGGALNTGGASGAGAGSGGRSSGGTSSGGASSGGTTSMSGAGGAVLMEPPPNCESVRQSADPESCDYEYTCDALTHFDSCRRESDGVWACDCGTFSTPTRYFEVEGVEGLEACGLIARICESEVPVSPTRTCRAKEASVEGDTCSARASCGSALLLDAGVLVREVEHYGSECEAAEDTYFSGFRCSCAGGAFDRESHLVSAPSIDDVCEPMLGLCTDEELPDFSDPICADAAPYGSVDQVCPVGEDCRGCTMSQMCGTSAQIARDVSLVNLDDALYRYVICRPEEGELQCTCETSTEGLYGDDSVPQEILDVCGESREVCPVPSAMRSNGIR
jgi:hypothetical protein